MGNYRVRAAAFVVAASVPSLIAPTAAIDSQPTQQQIRAALARGKEAAQQRRPPDALYVRFGQADSLQPGGFLITKVGSLSVLAAHMALRGLEPAPAEITRLIEAPTMLVSTVIFGDVPSFAVDSYMVLDQGGKSIKPITVRYDAQAERSAVWPNTPRFKAKVVASFNYTDFDPAAKSTISVFPADGGVVSFSLDFSQIE